MHVILLALAFAFAVVATFEVGSPRFALGWASLAFFFLDLLLVAKHVI